MFDVDVNNESVKINYCSDADRARTYNELAVQFSDSEKVYNCDWLGGYRYPILDWVSSQLSGAHYQILKANRPTTDTDEALLDLVLRDPNTLYAYPSGSAITIVQFAGWDNRKWSLANLGIDIKLGQKLFKRIKTLNRAFRAFHYTTDPIKVMLVGDTAFSRYYGEISDELGERLFDGAFIISPTVVAACMEQFDIGTTVFDDDVMFSSGVFNRNTEVGAYYKNSKVFNARIFGPMSIVNEGSYEELGALKGQAFTDFGGLCEDYGVDVIAPFSAFKEDLNISTGSFFLIEPQNAKLGQMFSDGQTIANLPALYQWRDVHETMGAWFEDTYKQLVNNKILSQWSDMTFAQFDSDKPKMFDVSDVNAITMWNVRAWLTCGGKLSDSPWLFQQMGRNIYDSMHIEDPRKLRFPVPSAARAQVISETLIRAIKGVTDTADDTCRVELGDAHWDKDLHVLVVNDHDYIEMYESHGGCDLDDFFQIYWRTMDGKRKIIICRSPNDWGEYSIFNYVPGDWYSTTTQMGSKIDFPEVSTDDELWADRLSEVLESGEVTYTGLPEHKPTSTSTEFNADYVLDRIKDTSASAGSVGINVNARQLWSDAMKCHREVQLCSMEDAIDAGVQGGSDEQVQAVIADGAAIIQELIDSGVPLDKYLWRSKHENFYKEDVPTYNGNITYLQSVRHTHGTEFQRKVAEYAETIPENADYSLIHALGTRYLNAGVGLVRQNRLNIARMNRSSSIDPSSWEMLSESILMTIEGYAEGHERNSFMISLYSACLKLPTSSGKITDQFVMQPQLFKYLLEALQFYGVLCYLEVDGNGHMTRHRTQEWKFYDNNAGKMVHFTDPVSYQAWYFNTTTTEETASS